METRFDAPVRLNTTTLFPAEEKEVLDREVVTPDSLRLDPAVPAPSVALTEVIDTVVAVEPM